MNTIYNTMVYIVWFFATYYMVFIILSLFTYRKELFHNNKILKREPFVTFIIPAFNEEADVLDTIKSLKKLEYKKIEFLIMNDGSSDKTPEIIREGIKGDSRFTFIDNKHNQGKAGIMNEGIKLAKGEFIACMDADSVVESNIVSKILPYFNTDKIGSVTVSVEVNKPKTLLQKIIAIEFSLGLSLLLKLFSFLDCIFVTPGPFSMYKASVLKEIGGFDINNITEDHEIAYRLHKAGYKISNCLEAKVFTTLPDTFKGNYIQRKRWYSGSILTMFQHRDVILNKKYGLFGVFIPFNMMLVIMGISLFAASSFMFLSKWIKELMYFRYTNFNFFENWRIDFSLLYYGRVNLLGFSMLAITIFFTLFGLAMVGKKYRDNKLGLIGFPLFFFFYQIFWFGAFWAVIKGGKIKWR